MPTPLESMLKIPDRDIGYLCCLDTVGQET